MTEVVGVAQSAGDSPLDYAVLAAGVAAVKGPRGPASSHGEVADALARRAAGQTYEAIAEEVGISAKRAASWCRAAARIEPRFDARAAKPRSVRKDAAAKAPLEKLIGWRPRPGTRAVLERRAELEGRSLTDLVQAAVDSYVQRKTAGVESLVRRELRKQLKAELRAVADAVSAQSVELTRQGSNLNQLSRFVNRYRELPVAITHELAAYRAELAANRTELARLSAAVESLVGGGDQ
ncbi:hypothetical protein R4144_00755 [Gordonia amicalis]|uniref:hypothetical protein n=1 Tax=Gordonia amicalis TaxID=89053 RepID=UPI002954469A|nr:hypothetical protein [Gordonia amicalis]MDV7171946.1 hypothetical protein [Gordonia amicalis]